MELLKKVGFLYIHRSRFKIKVTFYVILMDVKNSVSFGFMHMVNLRTSKSSLYTLGKRAEGGGSG